jgi:hypothetical protein
MEYPQLCHFEGVSHFYVASRIPVCYCIYSYSLQSCRNILSRHLCVLLEYTNITITPKLLIEQSYHTTHILFQVYILLIGEALDGLASAYFGFFRLVYLFFVFESRALFSRLCHLI